MIRLVIGGQETGGLHRIEHVVGDAISRVLRVSQIGVC